jgi:4a-hydroxytetrahydrobiopterin dehydratase
MAKVLTADEIAAGLTELAEWEGGPGGIRRRVQADSFLAGIALVDAVAQAAEAADHHPDIDIRWRTVIFTLITHSAGGVTDKDLDMARTVERLITSG